MDAFVDSGHISGMGQHRAAYDAGDFRPAWFEVEIMVASLAFRAIKPPISGFLSSCDLVQIIQRELFALQQLLSDGIVCHGNNLR